MDEGDGDGSFTDGGGDAFDVAAADVADSEDAWQACFEKMGCAGGEAGVVAETDLGVFSAGGTDEPEFAGSIVVSAGLGRGPGRRRRRESGR